MAGNSQVLKIRNNENRKNYILNYSGIFLEYEHSLLFRKRLQFVFAMIIMIPAKAFHGIAGCVAITSSVNCVAAKSPKQYSGLFLTMSNIAMLSNPALSVIHQTVYHR